MRTLLHVFLFMNCILLQAQHRPLKYIPINDIYISQCGSSKTYNIGNTRETYDSYFNLGRKRIEHQKGIKDYDIGYDRWGISIQLDPEDAIAIESYAKISEGIGGLNTGISTLQISVGESLYDVKAWYYSPSTLSLIMDTSKSITEHISVSGFQGIHTAGIEIISFSEIEQELWRRSAEDVFNVRK